MILNLTDLSGEPLQSQIYRQIRAMILSGDLKAAEMLPSIRRLAREEKVSVITIQRGYELLEREGLILSRRGKGFFVSEIHELEKKELAKKIHYSRTYARGRVFLPRAHFQYLKNRPDYHPV